MMKFRILLLLAALSLSKAFAASNSAIITLNATIPDTCTIQVLENISPLMLGEAIRTRSDQRFTVPIQIECNSYNSVLRARPFSLTNSKAPGYEIYYHINTDQGAASGLGWINTSFTTAAPIAQFNQPVSQQIYVWIEGFKETAGRTPPSGDYTGIIQLSIDAQ